MPARCTSKLARLAEFSGIGVTGVAQSMIRVVLPDDKRTKPVCFAWRVTLPVGPHLLTTSSILTAGVMPPP